MLEEEAEYSEDGIPFPLVEREIAEEVIDEGVNTEVVPEVLLESSSPLPFLVRLLECVLEESENVDGSATVNES